MGTFVNFTGDMSVPEEEMELFNRYMQKILDIGGIMDLSRVELDFDEIFLLEPVICQMGRSTAFALIILRIVCWRRLIMIRRSANWRQAKSAEENLDVSCLRHIPCISVSYPIAVIWK